MKLKAIGNRYYIWCPACDCVHGISTPSFNFNDDLVSPSFDPPSMVNGGRPNECHFSIQNGQIQFLEGSGHGLVGQTVPMADFPDPDWPANEGTP